MMLLLRHPLWRPHPKGRVGPCLWLQRARIAWATLHHRNVSRLFVCYDTGLHQHTALPSLHSIMTPVSGAPAVYLGAEPRV